MSIEIKTFTIEEAPRRFTLVINGKRFDGFELESTWEGLAKFVKRDGPTVYEVVAVVPRELLPNDNFIHRIQDLFNEERQLRLILATPFLLAECAE